MELPERKFEWLSHKFANHAGIEKGNMMSSPGLKFNNKVFAFYHQEQMGFRLGPNFDPKKIGIQHAKPLSPFKTKPPLRGWFMVDKSEVDLWESLTEMALEFTQTLK